MLNIASYIDHTLLKPDAPEYQVEAICHEAISFEFYSVCLNPSRIAFAANILHSETVKLCSVIGFPLGATPGSVKGFEARKAVDDGANEIDMVINIGALKDGNLKLVESDIITVRKNCGDDIILKVIIETSLLTESEKIAACEIAVKAGADFVKTSTGFALSGATVEDIILMKEAVKGKAKIKASGGIKTFEDAIKMINAGADRIGTSSGKNIMETYKMELRKLS